MKVRVPGISLIVFLAAVAGMVISAGNLKEDVFSTAYTLFEYFPAKFAVTPTTTFTGALWLGGFTTAVQVISGFVATSKKFPVVWRIVAGVVLALSLPFDAWTDIVHRSSWLLGNVIVATAVTLAFYTFGSEITQALAWMVIFATWREANSDVMWGAVRFFDGLMSIGEEFKRFASASKRKERKALDERTRHLGNGDNGGSKPSSNHRPAPKPLNPDLFKRLGGLK